MGIIQKNERFAGHDGKNTAKVQWLLWRRPWNVCNGMKVNLLSPVIDDKFGLTRFWAVSAFVFGLMAVSEVSTKSLQKVWRPALLWKECGFSFFLDVVLNAHNSQQLEDNSSTNYYMQSFFPQEFGLDYNCNRGVRRKHFPSSFFWRIRFQSQLQSCFRGELILYYSYRRVFSVI